MSSTQKKTQTLDELFSDGFKTYQGSGRPAEIIFKGLDRLFEEVTSELFNGNGPFAASVKQELAKALPANLDTLMDLPGYNQLMATTIRDRLMNEGLAEDMKRRMNQAVDEVLADAPQEYVSLRLLLESFIESNQERATEQKWHVPHVLFQEGGGIGGRSRYIHVFFDAEPEYSYRARNNLREAPRNETEFANRMTVQIKGQTDLGYEYGKVITMLQNDEPIGRNFSMNNKWERMMAALYFGKSKLVIDCRDVEFTYPL